MEQGYLHFEVLDSDCPHAIVGGGTLYLLDEQSYRVFAASKNRGELTGLHQIEFKHIAMLEVDMKSRVVSIFSLHKAELAELQFPTRSHLKQFITRFSGFEKEVEASSKRIKPMSALLFMLFTYAFLWAGTRPTPADIHPEKIRLRVAALVVRLMQWLEGIIGQQGILIAGVLLTGLFLYLVFRPELSRLRSQRVVYVNTAPIAKD